MVRATETGEDVQGVAVLDPDGLKRLEEPGLDQAEAAPAVALELES
jgi:hypothetical protein